MKKKKTNFYKFLRIIYLIFGTIVLTYFFFYSPKDQYSKDYRIHKTQASKIFINSISSFIVPSKDIYKCGEKYVSWAEYAICWGEKYNRDPKEWSVLGLKETTKDIIKSFNNKKPTPSIIDGRAPFRNKFRFALSIFFFVAGIFLLWRTRFKFSKIIQNIYDKA